MTFVYDIYVNFQNIYYDFYEWNKKDTITHIKKIPIFQIEDKKFQKLIPHDYQIDLHSFEIFKMKTETFKPKEKISAVLFTDGSNIIALLFDNNGNIIKKSCLLLEEESTILKSIRKIDFLDIQITELDKKKITLETRLERERKEFLLQQITRMKDSELYYLYYECFGKKVQNRKLIEKELKAEVLMGNENISVISYNFLKLMCNQS